MRRWTVVALIGVLTLAAGLLAGSLLFPRTLPSSAGESTADARMVPVSMQSFDDARKVKATATWTDGAQLLSGDSGVITSVDCTAGGTWTAGAAPLSINDRPRVTIHTTRPLWRDLQDGEKGPDVEALQGFLDGQGYATSDSGWYDWSTAVNWREFLRDRGVSTDSTAFTLSSVIVLPSDTVTLQTCPSTGASVSPGAAIATQAPSLNAVSVVMPEGVPGERTVTIGDTTAPIDASGKVATPAVFAAVPEVVQARAAGAGKDEIDATIKLAAPLQVAMVPPSAIYSIAGGKGCVSDRDRAMPATIISSSLGLTAVTFEAGRSPAQVEAKPNTGQACG